MMRDAKRNAKREATILKKTLVKNNELAEAELKRAKPARKAVLVMKAMKVVPAKKAMKAVPAKKAMKAVLAKKAKK